VLAGVVFAIDLMFEKTGHRKLPATIEEYGER
jgi:hypothetical protein